MRAIMRLCICWSEKLVEDKTNNKNQKPWAERNNKTKQNYSLRRREKSVCISKLKCKISELTEVRSSIQWMESVVTIMCKRGRYSIFFKIVSSIYVIDEIKIEKKYFKYMYTHTHTHAFWWMSHWKYRPYNNRMLF